MTESVESPRIIRICDFFSGTHSWTAPWLDWWSENTNVELEIFSIDNNADYADTTTVIKDFLELTADEVLTFFGGHPPDVILASPPCTAFSVASIGKHWGGGNRAYLPKTEMAVLSQRLVQHTLALVEELDPAYFWMENPRGVLRKLPFMRQAVEDGLDHTLVWYCQYGPTHGILRAKPTDLWGRFPSTWNPRPICKNGNPDCNHVRAPRGAKTGTQGLANNRVRSMIPIELTREIMEACLEDLRL